MTDMSQFSMPIDSLNRDNRLNRVSKSAYANVMLVGPVFRLSVIDDIDDQKTEGQGEPSDCVMQMIVGQVDAPLMPHRNTTR